MLSFYTFRTFQLIQVTRKAVSKTHPHDEALSSPSSPRLPTDLTPFSTYTISLL